MKLDRTNQLLGCTVLILLAFVAVRGFQGFRPAEALWSVPPIPPASVQAIAVSSPEGQLRIERSEQGWAIVSPEQGPADTEAVEALLAAWSSGFAPDKVLFHRASDMQLAEFGLDPAERSGLSLERAEAPSLQLELGRSMPGGHRLLRPVGSSAIFQGQLPLGPALDPDPAAWRDRHLFAFEPSELRSITLRGSQGQFVFERSVEGSWTASAPSDLVPSRRQLEGLVRTLRGLEYRRRVEGEAASAERAGAGLGDGALELRVEAGSESAATLRLGAALDDEHGLWAELEGEAGLLVLPSALRGKLDRSPEAWALP